MSNQMLYRLRPYELAINDIPGAVQRKVKGRNPDGRDKWWEDLSEKDPLLKGWWDLARETINPESTHKDFYRLRQLMYTQLHEIAGIDRSSARGANSRDIFSTCGFMGSNETLEGVKQNYLMTLKMYGLTPEVFSRCLDLLIQPMEFAAEYFF